MSKKKKSKKPRVSIMKAFAIVCAGFCLMLGGLMIAGSTKRDNTEQISYSEYLVWLEEGKVSKVIYSSDSGLMTVSLFDDQSKDMTIEEREDYETPDTHRYITYYPDYDDFKKDLLEKDVIVQRASANFFGNVMENLDTWLSLIMVIALVGIMTKNTPLASTEHYNLVDKDDIETGFDDVIGHDEVKEDLKLLVKQLKEGANAADLSHGILFEGGAGTGKTMLAKAVAKEAGVNFISVDSSNLIAMYVGLGAKRVRDVFKMARKHSPCVLFFDEIDAIGRSRGNQRTTGENDQTINAMLTELDGFQKKGDVIVIAATNAADKLDQALLRSGRFDRKIKIEAPSKWETRKELFDHYLKDKTGNDVDTTQLAKEVVGFSGADIANVCREARLIAFRDGNEKITQENLQEAIDKIVFKGNRSNSERHIQDLEVVAYHEAGHAVMSLLRGEDISRVSIHGMTSGVGGAVFHQDTDRCFTTKNNIITKIMTAYAGRASEEIHFGITEVTEGAGNDISQATAMIQSYVMKCGFDNVAGLVDYTLLAGEGQFPKSAEKRIVELSKEFYADTKNELQANYELVELLAQKLLETKTLSGDEVKALLNLNVKKG